MLRIGATQVYVDPLAAGINDLQELSKTHEDADMASHPDPLSAAVLSRGRSLCW